MEIWVARVCDARGRGDEKNSFTRRKKDVSCMIYFKDNFVHEKKRRLILYDIF